MTKKPTAAEIEAARIAFNRTPHVNITDVARNIINRALAWCAEQEQKGE